VTVEWLPRFVDDFPFGEKQESGSPKPL